MIFGSERDIKENESGPSICLRVYVKGQDLIFTFDNMAIQVLFFAGINKREIILTSTKVPGRSSKSRSLIIDTDK